jgi:hypothetical protein
MEHVAKVIGGPGGCFLLHDSCLFADRSRKFGVFYFRSRRFSSRSTALRTKSVRSSSSFVPFKKCGARIDNNQCHFAVLPDFLNDPTE